MLLIAYFVSTGACTKKPPVEILDGSKSVMCVERCIAVTPGFVQEHAALFEEAIKLRHALKECRDK